MVELAMITQAAANIAIAVFVITIAIQLGKQI